MRDSPLMLVFPTQAKIKEWTAAGTKDIATNA
jgi:hypothetical protein